jgi:hypothetical protein
VVCLLAGEKVSYWKEADCSYWQNDVPASSHLSSLALKASNSLLSPLSSHLGSYKQIEVSKIEQSYLSRDSSYDVNLMEGGAISSSQQDGCGG